MGRTSKNFVVFMGLALLISACSYSTQTTSGKAYLRNYPGPTLKPTTTATENQIRAAADVEPILTFPARIGIARIDQCRLVSLPSVEIDAWHDLGQRLGIGWGEAVPISPLIAALASGPTTQASRRPSNDGRSAYAADGPQQDNDCLQNTVSHIRLGAARQHVDAVLIYEAFGKSEESENLLSIMHLTLIGPLFFPTQSIDADGFAHAVLVDVRNGYSYGTASAIAQDAATTVATIRGADDAHGTVQNKATAAAVTALTTDVEKMFRTLYAELNGRQKAAVRGR